MHAGRDGAEQWRDEALEFIDRFGVIERTVTTENEERRIGDTSEFRSEYLNVTARLSHRCAHVRLPHGECPRRNLLD